ncbi:MAG: hypothetical protein ACNA71_04320 [Kiritimatiellia bacterium]
MQTICPVCKRYCGPANACPYCDTTIPLSTLYRRIRLTAWLLATIGLAMLLVAAGKRSPETVAISEITPTMQFARLFFEGEITRTPRISRNQNSAATDLDDGSGSTLRIVFLEEAVHAIQSAMPPLTNGTRMRVRGGLRIQADEPPVMFIRTPDQFQVIEQPES